MPAYWKVFPWKTSIKRLKTFSAVPGRFELIEEGQPFAVVVDYAHTPDGLENILQTAKAIQENRIIVVSLAVAVTEMQPNVLLWDVLQHNTVMLCMLHSIIHVQRIPVQNC